MRWPISAICLPLLLSTGCSWIKPRSDFERDPFVMSHLSKDSSRDLAADNDLDGRRSFIAASTSRKRFPSPRSPEGSSSRAADYSWIEGRIERASTDNGKLQIVYGEANDEFGGRVVIEEGTRSRLLREGDLAILEGELVTSRFESPRYRVRNASILN